MQKPISDIRLNYQKGYLLEDSALPNAIDQFKLWFKEAVEAKISEVNAMALSTADTEGNIFCRIVLLKGVEEDGFVFFTNYESHKGMQLLANPKASLVFFWKELERQVRISGRAEKINDAANDAYFYSRPFESQLGAVTSPQSQTIENRKWLDENFETLKQNLNPKEIKRPKHWGGFKIIPNEIEYWQGRPNRLHDRLLYQFEENKWIISRLAP